MGLDGDGEERKAKGEGSKDIDSASGFDTDDEFLIDKAVRKASVADTPTVGHSGSGSPSDQSQSDIGPTVVPASSTTMAMMAPPAAPASDENADRDHQLALKLHAEEVQLFASSRRTILRQRKKELNYSTGPHPQPKKAKLAKLKRAQSLQDQDSFPEARSTSEAAPPVKKNATKTIAAKRKRLAKSPAGDAMTAIAHEKKKRAAEAKVTKKVGKTVKISGMPSTPTTTTTTPKQEEPFPSPGPPPPADSSLQPLKDHNQNCPSPQPAISEAPTCLETSKTNAKIAHTKANVAKKGRRRSLGYPKWSHKKSKAKLTATSSPSQNSSRETQNTDPVLALALDDPGTSSAASPAAAVAATTAPGRKRKASNSSIEMTARAVTPVPVVVAVTVAVPVPVPAPAPIRRRRNAIAIAISTSSPPCAAAAAVVLTNSKIKKRLREPPASRQPQGQGQAHGAARPSTSTSVPTARARLKLSKCEFCGMFLRNVFVLRTHVHNMHTNGTTGGVRGAVGVGLDPFMDDSDCGGWGGGGLRGFSLRNKGRGG